MSPYLAETLHKEKPKQQLSGEKGSSTNPILEVPQWSCGGGGGLKVRLLGIYS